MYDVPRVAVKTIGRMEKVLEDFIREAGSDGSAPESVVGRLIPPPARNYPSKALASVASSSHRVSNSIVIRPLSGGLG